MSTVPGSAEQLHAIAAHWSSRGDLIAHTAASARAAGPESWRGVAASAFAQQQSSLANSLQTTAERVSAAARVIDAHAAILAGLDAKGTALNARRDHSLERLRRNPLDAAAHVDLIAVQFAQQSLYRQAAASADDAARQLLALVEVEGAGSQNWWDPFGWWDDESIPDEDIDEDALDDTIWDPSYVQQGHIGDCYALTTVMGYMDTPAGREMLENNIRWDADKDGYWVTLYDHGNAKEYFVDNVYEHGVNQYEGKTLWWENTSPNVVSLYEAALAQADGYDDINDGGTVTSAIEAISGRPATYVDFGTQGFDNSLSRMSDALDAGSAVVATTGTGSGTVPLDDVSVQRLDGTVEVTDIDIVRKHAYQVDHIGSDGSVWVRNPWGPGNSADGGGVLQLTPEQFRRAFTQAGFEEAPWPS